MLYLSHKEERRVLKWLGTLEFGTEGRVGSSRVLPDFIEFHVCCYVVNSEIKYCLN